MAQNECMKCGKIHNDFKCPLCHASELCQLVDEDFEDNYGRFIENEEQDD